MNLTQLLEGLSKEEWEELVVRRQVQQVPQDRLSLTDTLSLRQSLASALYELNAFQLLLLRWLVARPGYETTWKALLDDVGAKAPADYLKRQARDLRLWGLIDYRCSPNDGSIGTFPAVAAVLPRRTIRLRDALVSLGSEDLRHICSALGHVHPSNLKATRLNLIVESLRDPAFVQALVSRLSPEAGDILTWIRSRGDRVSVTELKQQTSSLPAPARRAYGSDFLGYGVEPDALRELKSTCLVLPMTTGYGGYYDLWRHATDVAVPEEVVAALSSSSMFDQEPLLPPELLAAEGASGDGFSPIYLVRDINHLLGFIASGGCEWRQDGQPYERSLAAFRKAIGASDREYPALLWELAQAGDLIGPARGGRSYRVLAPEDDSPAALLDRVLEGWVNPGQAALFRGISPLTSRRRARFFAALSALPADTWLLRESVESWLAFTWPWLFRQGQTDSPDLNGLWALGWRLGIAMGKTPDDREAIRLPRALQVFLSGEGKGDEALLPPWEDGWVVQPDRTIVAPPNARASTLLELWQVAALESNQGAAVFRVTGASVAAPINRGMKPRQVLQLLRKGSKTPLPATVERLVEEHGRRYGQIKVGPALAFVQTEDPAVLEELMRDRKLKGIAWQQLAPGVACVQTQDAATLLDLFRKAGHLPVMVKSKQAAGGATAGTGNTWTAPRGFEGMDAAGAPPLLAALVTRALESEQLLALRWADGHGTNRAAVEPLEIKGNRLYAIDHDSGDELSLDLRSLRSASIVESEEE
ncbi:MAG: helicase-associated domain-containing protein [Chloroflexi bacterium]|nr:helicase-associated domain-containing protein [Chloroflexota bacterium]